MEKKGWAVVQHCVFAGSAEHASATSADFQYSRGLQLGAYLAILLYDMSPRAYPASWVAGVSGHTSVSVRIVLVILDESSSVCFMLSPAAAVNITSCYRRAELHCSWVGGCCTGACVAPSS